nr:leader peptide [Vibrio sp.]
MQRAAPSSLSSFKLVRPHNN